MLIMQMYETHKLAMWAKYNIFKRCSR